MNTNRIISPNNGISQVHYSTAGHTVPIKWHWPKRSKNLLISFHCTVDRNNRVPPVFPSIIPELGNDVAQLSVSDPMMMRAGPLSVEFDCRADLPSEEKFELVCDESKLDAGD